MADASPPLSPLQFERYRRHLSLPELGLDGQRALLDGRVLLVGAGGLGCPLAQYLAAAGVGTLGIVDFDVVDVSNLQRQVLYGVADVGRPKVEVAAERVRAQNPDVQVVMHREQVRASNALDLLRGYDVVIDGTDNFPTRYLLNDACVMLGLPNVHGSIFRFDGQATVFDAGRGPCYRCLYPQPPPPGAVPSCAEGGVLGVLPGLVAMIQATEAVKLLTGLGEPLIGRLLRYDALRMEFSEFRLKKDAGCPVCGESPSIRELADTEGLCGAPAPPAEPQEVAAAEVAAARARGEALLLLDVRDREERDRARIEGTVWLPLDELEARMIELDEWRQGRVIVQCHHGVRSLRACELLRERGFADVASLAGGIEAWSLTVDPGVPRY